MTTTPSPTPSDLSPRRFAGRTVIVTGAGSGIGLATTLRLLDEGAAVVAVDLVAERLDALVEQRPDHDVRPVHGDVVDPATASAAVEAAGGTVHGLATIAGIMDGFLAAGEVDDETWTRVLDVNLSGTMRFVRAALPLVAESGGAIVTIASEAAFRGSAAGAAYTASKHAVVGLTRSVAFSYAARGVRCNAVAPGAVATNIDGSVRSELAGERLFPLLGAVSPTITEPERIAAAVTWLLSEDSANVNGTVLASDAGWSVV